MKIVFVDLDGTLLNRKGSELYFALNLIQRGMIGPKQIISYLLFFFRWLPYLGLSATKKNKAYLTGLVESHITAMGEKFANDHLKRYVRINLSERIECHRQKGHHLVLLTGSLDTIAKPLAKIFNIPEVHATRCATRNGIFIDNPPLSHPSGNVKRHIAQLVAKNHNSMLTECTAYADSIDDLPLLFSVAEPVAVNPSTQLRHIARSKKWEIL